MFAQIDKEMIAKRKGKLLGRVVSWALIEGRPLTTRGQWINPLVFALYRAAQFFPRRKGSDAPIIVIGTGRSGTTVLGKLFAMHGETVFLNEPKAAWHFIHGEEDIAGTYSTGAARVRLDSGDAEPRMAKRLARIYSWAMRWGMARRVVDKYPELVFRISFVKELFPKARFIAIMRDGVDTCSSVTNWSRRNTDLEGDQVHDWWGRNSRKWRLLVEQIVPEHPDLAPLVSQLTGADDHRDRAAVEWIVSMREVAKVGREYPDEVLAIRYEDLCAKTEDILAEMLQHAGLSPDPVFENYATTILSQTEQYAPLELMPELVEPFRNTLAETGYGASKDRVVVRK